LVGWLVGWLDEIMRETIQQLGLCDVLSLCVITKLNMLHENVLESKRYA
jgi:hypothetical protein